MGSLEDQELRTVYGLLRDIVFRDFSTQQQRNLAAAMGLDVTSIPAESERRSRMGSRAAIMPEMDTQFGRLSPERKLLALTTMAQRILAHDATAAGEMNSALARYGYRFTNDTFMSIEPGRETKP